MKKFLKWTGITIGIIFLLLLIAPFLFKGKIMEAVKTAANENLNAVVNFHDISLSLIRNFPNLRVSIEKFTIDNVAPFDSVRMADIGSIDLVVDIKSVFGDVIQVKRVGISDANLDIRVLADGTANYDIAKEDTTAAVTEEETPAGESSFKMNLKEYYLENTNLKYDDLSLPYSLELKGMDHRGSGDFTAEQFVLETITTVDTVTTAYDGITYIKNAKSEIKANLDIENKETMKITFSENEIKLNELILAANGWFSMPPDGSYEMDITYAATKTDFRNLLSMVPAAFASDLAGVDVSGKMAFDGFVRGKYSDTSMPGFGVNLLVENGRFKYPDLPGTVDNIQVKAAIDATDGNDYDKMKIDVDKFHLEMAANPVDMTLKLRTPMSDPDIDFGCKATIDLDKMKEFIPVEETDEVHGNIAADVKLKGKMSSIEQERYEEFYAAGNLDVKNVLFRSDSLPYDVQVNNAAFAFTPAYLDLSAFNAQIGRSDLSANGKIENYLAYALKDSLLTGRFNLSSQLLDLNEFMTDEETATAEADSAPADTSALSPIELPGNVDFELNSSFAKMIYDDIEITNVKGGITLRDKIASLNNLAMNVLDAAVTMGGSYNAQDLSAPKTDFTFDIRDMDINKAANKFNTIDKLAPIAKSCTGKFSTKMAVRSTLDQEMMPINQTVNGSGSVQTKSVVITDFKPLVKIAEATKIDELKTQTISDVNVSFKIIDGVVHTDPFTVKLSGMPAKIYGTTTLDQVIDYNVEMDIPFEKFPSGAVNQANSLVAMANEKLGTNFSAGSKLPVKLKVTGTVTDPKIGTNYGELGKEAAGNLKDEVVAMAKEEAKEQINKAKDEAIAEAIKQKEQLVAEAQKASDALVATAQAQADKAKKEAETVAKKAKDEAYKQAKKLEDDAKGNPLKQAGAKIAADKIRKEADETYTKAVNEANKKADAPVVEARKQGDKLVKDAEAKGDKLIADANAKATVK